MSKVNSSYCGCYNRLFYSLPCCFYFLVILVCRSCRKAFICKLHVKNLYWLNLRKEMFMMISILLCDYIYSNRFFTQLGNNNNVIYCYLLVCAHLLTQFPSYLRLKSRLKKHFPIWCLKSKINENIKRILAIRL